MKKEKILNVIFDNNPDVRVRVIYFDDSPLVKNDKKKYPFKLYNPLTVQVITTCRNFKFKIYEGYTWNGADIPRVFWRIIGSRTDNDYLTASMVHDYLLEFKSFIINEILSNQISIKQYRRLTTLIFRFIIKKNGTNTFKANIMSWCVDIFQMINFRSWKC